MFDVDAVISWVDGSDRELASKRNRYKRASLEKVAPTAAIKHRFASHGELRYCVRSIRNHAPWIRKIWIVTDGQKPKFLNDKTLASHSIQIVDHKDIFHGLEELLPTFNSQSIETMMWRIRELSDHFIYFNDDMILTAPVSIGDFFNEDGAPLLRGIWAGKTKKKISFHDQRKIRAAKMAGFSSKNYFSCAHAGYVMRKSALERLFEENRPAFVGNAAYRFRSPDQFWAISFHDHSLLSKGEAFVVSPEDTSYLSITKSKAMDPVELRHELDRAVRGEIKIMCINHAKALSANVPELKTYLETIAGPPLKHRGKRKPAQNVVA